MNLKLSGIQYKLLSQFYGVEEYIDYEVPLREQIDCLSTFQDDFSLTRKLLDLDIWYGYIYNKNQDNKWDPFSESFSIFLQRYDCNVIFARYLAEKQYKDKQILDFIQ